LPVDMDVTSLSSSTDGCFP